jgi:hypothetical protein
MLHKLQMPAYRPQLEAILDFQYRLLFFACTAPALPLNTAILKAAFGDKQGNWLSERCWRQRKATLFYKELAKLIDYVTRNPLEGTAIIDAFSNDRDFYNRLNDPDFEFQYSKLSKDAKEVIEPLMISFYERLLRTGFPDYIHLCNRETFTYKILLKDFYAANNDLVVCPGCDGPRPKLNNETLLGIEMEEEGKKRNRNYAEVDHFFPKALYPFFSIHFMNLVPLCPTCNLKAKQDKDPLNEDVGKGVLNHTFLPFIKPAMPCIEVLISRDVNSLRRVKIKDAQRSSSHRVQNLDATFELSDNWEDHLRSWIGNMMFEIGGLRTRGRRDRQKIERQIKERLRPLAKAPDDSIGKMTHLLIERVYASYVLKDPRELELLIDQAMDDNAPKGNIFRR